LGGAKSIRLLTCVARKEIEMPLQFGSLGSLACTSTVD